MSPIDGTHVCVMPRQHARPMERFAGYNGIGDLLGKPMLPLHIDWYVTVLDPGSWGALYPQGWTREVVAKESAAKLTKKVINRDRI
jgi:NADH dehydrogenase